MTPELSLTQEPPSAPPQPAVKEKDGDQIVTSAEEIEGFHIVRAILRDCVPLKRIHMRDAQTYCAILLDDNNRKPICRLRFNNTEKLAVGLFNENKEEERFTLSQVEDLYNHSDAIRSALMLHLPKIEA
jgi:hypothetical protein